MSTKPDIYDQFDTAFRYVGAFVVVKDGKRVATVAFKRPRGGAGRLYAYVHWLGLHMVRGFAGGGGYDKHSAAVASTAAPITRAWHNRHDAPTDKTEKFEEAAGDELTTFVASLSDRDGRRWDDRLRNAGFDVWEAV